MDQDGVAAFMAKLPLFQSSDKTFILLQNSWVPLLNPVLSNELVNSSVLTDVLLTSGPNMINHLLGRILQGWMICRQRAAANIYDLQDTNSMPNLTLILHSDANVVVDIVVF